MYIFCILLFFFFFFQAEDGIRDRDVTGVQTCALPIYSHTCYVRLAYLGQQQPTFSLCLHLPTKRSEEQLTLLRERCQRTYCRPASDIEQRLIEALGRAIAASVHRQQESERSKTATRTEEAP